MTKLKIVKYSDKKHSILTKKTHPIKEITPEIQQLASDMIETMYSVPGVGLAANQVGKSLSIIVIDITKEKNSPVVLFNPCVTEKKGRVAFEEGCLSFPGINIEIKRPSYVKVNALNSKGKPITLQADGLLSRVLQHEIDHLEGKTMLDRIPFYKKLKYKLLLKKPKKQQPE